MNNTEHVNSWRLGLIHILKALFGRNSLARTLKDFSSRLRRDTPLTHSHNLKYEPKHSVFFSLVMIRMGQLEKVSNIAPPPTVNIFSYSSLKSLLCIFYIKESHHVFCLIFLWPRKKFWTCFSKTLLGKMVQLTQKLQECTMIKATLNCSVLSCFGMI